MRIYKTNREKIELYSNHSLHKNIQTSIYSLATKLFKSNQINKSCAGKCGILSQSLINIINIDNLKNKGFLVFDSIGNYPNSKHFSIPHTSGQPHVLLYTKIGKLSVAIDLTTLQSSNIKMQIYVSKNNSDIKSMISKRYNTSVNSIEIIPHNDTFTSAKDIFNRYRILNSNKLKQQIPAYITNETKLLYLPILLQNIRQLEQSQKQLTEKIFGHGPIASVFGRKNKRILKEIIQKINKQKNNIEKLFKK